MQYALHFMSSLSSPFVTLLSNGGYWVLSIIVVLEGLPVIGSFLPGHIVIIAAGFLAKLGILNLWAVLLTATVAIIVGDIIGFLLGRRYGYGVLYSLGNFFHLKKEYIDKIIEKTKRMIDTHAGKTIVFGKFSPITRPFTPFLVGASGVHIRKFWLYNIIGGIIWVFSSVMAGYIFGASYHVTAHYFGKLIVATIVATIFILWGFRLANKRFHIFRRYELFVLGLNVISLWALAKTVQDSFSIHSFMSNFDLATNLFIVEHVTSFIAKTGLWISAIGGTTSMIFLGLCIGCGFLIKEKWRRAAIILLSILSTSVAVTLMKNFFMRMRPHNALVALNDFSFPSGHASLAAAFFVAIAYVFTPHIHSWVKREGFIVLCALLTILIGVSRLATNVHWASDVIAGWALGVFLSTALILLVRYASIFFLKKRQQN